MTVITAMHLYVFWRAGSVPFIRGSVSRKYLLFTGMAFWLVFFLGRVVDRGETAFFAGTVELLGMNWMGMLFLTTVSLLVVDVVTGFGFLLTGAAPRLRGLALVAGILLSGIALFQGMRPPVVERHSVYLPGLPEEMDGTVLVALSDLHLGRHRGEGWLEARVAQVREQEPDVIVLLGDVFDGHGRLPEELFSRFRSLSAPLGVWAVTGNHDFHGREAGRPSRLDQAGGTLLRNSWAEVRPGLVLAGVDDPRGRPAADPVAAAIAGRPGGATILLSHRPEQAERAAGLGVGLMLSGHTHGGQIWPFGHFVKRRYPLLEGRYEVSGMTTIVSRGAGTWGPRMRLWRPGEILRVTLHSMKKAASR
jgi:predicted MPP superfamily phosphohydrolase